MTGLCCGCAHSQQQAINSFWTSVTPRQWSSKPTETPLEPRVSANVSDAEPPSGPEPAERLPHSSPTEETGRSWSSRFAQRPRSPQETPPGPDAASRPSPSDSPSPEPTTTAGPVAPAGRQNLTSLQRLRTALTLDFGRNSEIREPSAPGLDQTRFRVENLLTRSRALAEAGELAQARHLAQLAQQMAQESHLEFPPDAQRPVDVIAFLAQLESTTPPAPSQVQTTAYASAPGDPLQATPGAGPIPTANDAVLRVNQGLTAVDAAADLEQPPASLTDPPRDRPSAAGASLEPLPRAEPVRADLHAFNGVATVRERFRAHESPPAQIAPARSDTPPASATPTPSATPQRVVSLTWTWPSLVEPKKAVGSGGWPGLTLLIAAICLLSLAGGGWLVVRRRPRIAR